MLGLFQADEIYPLTRRKKFILYLVSVLLLGIVLRLYKWASYSFWYDEVVWLLTSKNLSTLNFFSTLTLKPPLFTIFLYLWQKLVSTEFLLRLPSLVFGLLSILLSYKLTNILFERRVAILVAFIISLSPFHIYYSQELTHYSLTLLLSLASMYFFILCWQRNEWHLWIGYTMVTTASIYTNYLCIFLLLVQNLFYFTFCLKRKFFLKGWLLSQGIVLLLISPLVFFFTESIYILKYFKEEFYSWIPKGDWRYILQTFNVFNLGYSTTKLSRIAGLALFFPLFLRGVWINRREREKLFILLFWLFGPIIFSIIIAYILGINTYTHRNFFFSSIPYYALVASALSKLPKRFLLTLLIIIVFLFAHSLHNYYRNIFFTPEKIYRPGVHLKKDNRGTTQYIQRNFKEQDTVLHVSHDTALPFVYYAFFSKDTSIRSLSARKEFLREFPLIFYLRFLIKDRKDIEDFTTGFSRVWLVYSHWEQQYLDSPDSEARKIKNAFDQMYSLIQIKEFEGISLFLYDLKRSMDDRQHWRA
jgi:hypothetical protein